MILYYDVEPPAATLIDALWLPTRIGSYNPLPNTEARSVYPYRTHRTLRDFLIPEADPEVVTGAEIEFILRIGDLYCARVLNPADPRTVAPWSFRLRDITLQKAGVTILNNAINPLKGEKTIITYELQQAGMVTVQVFDLEGDIVQVLFRGRQGAGSYSFTWDGKNRGGRVVARGMYFIRVVAPGIDEMRKVLIAK